MAHIIYDNDQPGHYNSAGHNSSRSIGWVSQQYVE
jgi:hypothetical protein